MDFLTYETKYFIFLFDKSTFLRNEKTPSPLFKKNERSKSQKSGGGHPLPTIPRNPIKPPNSSHPKAGAQKMWGAPRKP